MPSASANSNASKPSSATEKHQSGPVQASSNAHHDSASNVVTASSATSGTVANSGEPSDNSFVNAVMSPLRQAIVIIEHKIRNLEKRKAKLDSYRDLQQAGKELNTDQATAVDKYNEVTHTLQFAREICKQFVSIALVTEKEAKKQAKKDAATKAQCELARLREILLVQDALNQMGSDQVRDDFLVGRNGAAHLSEHELKLLDDVYPAVTPKHEAGNPTAFTNEVQSAAEHLLAVVDGKSKAIFGGTYSQVKEILGKIHESGYFDQLPATIEEPIIEQQQKPESEASGFEIAANEVVEIEREVEQIHANSQQQQQQSIMLHPVIDSVVIESVPPQPTQLAAAAPPHSIAPITTTAAAEQSSAVPNVYYSQQVPPPAQMVSRSPITEILSSSDFNFLQNSEIDLVVLPPPPSSADPITTQTYTNHFMGGEQQVTLPQPPPPPPMVSHPPVAAVPQIFQPLPPGIHPPNVGGGGGRSRSGGHHHHPHHNQHSNRYHEDSNGSGGGGGKPVKYSHNNTNNNHHVGKFGGGHNRHNSATNSGHMEPTTNNSYYQNDNGYNSRPRQQRNGPRSGHNRQGRE